MSPEHHFSPTRLRVPCTDRQSDRQEATMVPGKTASCRTSASGRGALPRDEVKSRDYPSRHSSSAVFGDHCW